MRERQHLKNNHIYNRGSYGRCSIFTDLLCHIFTKHLLPCLSLTQLVTCLTFTFIRGRKKERKKKGIWIINNSEDINDLCLCLCVLSVCSYVYFPIVDGLCLHLKVISIQQKLCSSIHSRVLVYWQPEDWDFLKPILCWTVFITTNVEKRYEWQWYLPSNAFDWFWLYGSELFFWQ